MLVLFAVWSAAASLSWAQQRVVSGREKRPETQPKVRYENKFLGYSILSSTPPDCLDATELQDSIGRFFLHSCLYNRSSSGRSITNNKTRFTAFSNNLTVHVRYYPELDSAHMEISILSIFEKYINNIINSNQGENEIEYSDVEYQGRRGLALRHKNWREVILYRPNYVYFINYTFPKGTSPAENEITSTKELGSFHFTR